MVSGMGLAGESVRIEIVDHITAEMIEQNFYVPGGDAGNVFRMTAENAGDHSNAMVYRTTAPVEHAPMDASKVSPMTLVRNFASRLVTGCRPVEPES